MSTRVKVLLFTITVTLFLIVNNIYATQIRVERAKRIGGVNIEVPHGYVVFESVTLSEDGNIVSDTFNTVDVTVYVPRQEDAGTYLLTVTVYSDGTVYVTSREAYISTTPTTYTFIVPDTPQGDTTYVMVDVKKIG